MTDPVQLAQELLRIPSPSGEEGALADWLLSFLKTFTEAERGPLGAVVGRVSQGKRPVILVEGHLDTVPAEVDTWSVPPFAGEIQKGFLFGRGAVDMKGPIAAQLAGAAEAVREIQGTLYLVYVPHEETAEGVALARVLEGIERPDLAILGEPTDLRLGIGHRGRAVIRLTVRGKAAHASMPELGENAIEGMVEALRHALLTPLPEDPVLGRGTVTPVAVSADSQGPVIPAHCTALLDRRLIQGETEEAVLADYQGLGAEVSLEEISLRFYTGESLRATLFFPAWCMEPEDPWVTRAWEALGSPPLRVWRFSTDGVETCARREIPTVGYGPGDESLAHQVDERVSVEDLRRGATGYARLLRALFTPLSIKGTGRRRGRRRHQ